MSVRERVLASRLSEKISENRKYAEKIGVSAIMCKTEFVPKASLRKDLTVSKNLKTESEHKFNL